MNLFAKLFGTTKPKYTQCITPSELIKKASLEFKKGNVELSISLIKRALEQEKNSNWYDKLANYQFVSGDKNEANKTIHEWIKNIDVKFINQFSYDIKVLNRKKIWEKNKLFKSEYDAIIHIKTIIDYCMNGDYTSYPSFDLSFDVEVVDQQVKNYLKEVKPILLAIDNEVKKIAKHYDENYLKYDLDHLNGYEITDYFMKDNEKIKLLVLQLKKHEIPFLNKLQND